LNSIMLRTAFQSSQAAFVPSGARSMATLKEISTRLKSVTSIQKITKSMKMVSAAKYARAEKALKDGRANGPATQSLLQKAKVDLPEADKQILVAISSDRGLCGGIHSGIAKAVKLALKAAPASVDAKVVAVGDKARTIIQRTHGDRILLSASEVGRRPPIFAEASFLAQEVLSCGFPFKSGTILYNHFKSAASYEVRKRPLFNAAALDDRVEVMAYEELDRETLQSYTEFTLAGNIFYTMLESTASEQSSRMTAMENASSNAGDMISSLRLTFNRTRQAVIARELIEIISGASALD